MKLIFPLDDHGSDALSEVLGFVDHSFKIESLKLDLYSATDELKELIGPEMYTIIQTASEVEEPSEEDAELVFRARAVVGINAYRIFAPDNDISHGTNGRTARVEEGQRQPWEWQIERSDNALEKKYYRAVDALLQFLDENEDEWKQSDAYKASHSLFVRTTKDFDSYFSINRSRLLLIKLTPGLRLAETSEILPRIGKSAFKVMKDKLKASEEVDSVLLEKIKEICVYKAIAWGLGRLSVQLFPEGVLQYKISDRLTIKGKAPALGNEADAAKLRFEADADAAIRDLEALLQPETIPEQDTGSLEPLYYCNNNFIST